MDILAFMFELESTPLANWIDITRGVYTIIESFHVLAVALVFGTIFVVDLRLLGLAWNSRRFTEVSRDLLRITWAGFALAIVSGSLLFITNAGFLYENFEFRTKMLMLFLAGINMLVFELYTVKSVSRWDLTVPPPPAVRFAGAASIVFWAAVVVFGRLIGFAASAAADPFASLV